MGNTGSTVSHTVTIQTSSNSDDNYEGNIQVNKCCTISEEIKKVLPTDDYAWNLFSVTPLQRHPYWKHTPLSEDDTVDSVNIEGLTIRAVRSGQKFFFPHWKLPNMHQPVIETSISCAETKTESRMLAGRNAQDMDPQLHSTSKKCTSWTCSVCETENNCAGEAQRCELCGEPKIGSEEAQRQALVREKIRSETKARMEQERRRIQPVPICLCGHSMALASDRTAPMRCPADAHADTEYARMVRFALAQERAAFIKCSVCHQFIDDDFGWRCGGCTGSPNTDVETKRRDLRRCDFVCCNDCKKTRASRWSCVQCGKFRGGRSGTVKVTSKKMSTCGIPVHSAPKYPGFQTDEQVPGWSFETFSKVELISGPRCSAGAGNVYLYYYKIGPEKWVHDFNTEDPSTRSLEVVDQPDSVRTPRIEISLRWRPAQ